MHLEDTTPCSMTILNIGMVKPDSWSVMQTLALFLSTTGAREIPSVSRSALTCKNLSILADRKRFSIVYLKLCPVQASFHELLTSRLGVEQKAGIITASLARDLVRSREKRLHRTSQS